MPVHLLVEGRNSAGTWSTVALSTSANRPAFSTWAMAGEFSVRKTSAGEACAFLDDLVGHLGVVALAQRSP